MNTSVSVKFTPSTKQFGKGRIYFQIIRKRVVRQFNPDIRLPNDMWISDNTFPCTKDEEINERIKQLIKQIRKCIEVLEKSGPNYSADDVIRAINDDRNNLVNYINLLSERFSMSGKKKTSENYKGLARRIEEFTGNDFTSIHDIDADFVETFEAWLLSRGVKRNTSSFYIRILRSVWNKAIDNGILPPTITDPFKHVYKGVDVTVKRAISVDDIKKIKSINLKAYPKLDFARDLFMFSFYTRGMSFIDIVCLKKENIQNGVITYQRRKTGKQIIIKMEKDIERIIKKYMRSDSDYIFPIATCKSDEYTKERNCLGYTNKSLKELAVYCNIEANLTMYVARHSWASIAHNVANVPLSVISKGMGHSNEKVTQIYLASFGNKDIDSANNNIINLI